MRQRSSCTSRPAASSGWRSDGTTARPCRCDDQLEDLDGGRGHRGRVEGGEHLVVARVEQRLPCGEVAITVLVGEEPARLGRGCGSPIASHGGPGARGSSSSHAGAVIGQAHRGVGDVVLDEVGARRPRSRGGRRRRRGATGRRAPRAAANVSACVDEPAGQARATVRGSVTTRPMRWPHVGSRSSRT